MSKDIIQLFEESKVRTHWDADTDKWLISIVDVIAILTDSKRPRKYWSDLKTKLKKEGSELSEKIGQLKMMVIDGEIRKIKISSVGANPFVANNKNNKIAPEGRPVHRK